jgi:hypothetical protein
VALLVLQEEAPKKDGGRVNPIKVPSKATLRKYGLDAQLWLAILESQGWVCAICKKSPPSGRMVTDHFHMPKRKWKTFPPEVRRTYVRGITCWTCNHYYLGRGINIEKATNVVLYLRAFEVRAEGRQRAAK